MKDKPRIVLNSHKSVPYLWRCYWGRYNGYADTLIEAYAACLRCASRSKYLMSDIKRNPQLDRVLS